MGNTNDRVGRLAGDRPNSNPESDSTRREAIVRCVAARLPSLSVDELRVLDVITTRMIGVGRGTYGPLDLARETRDWKAEQAAEYADAIFYGACHEVAANDARLERLRCEVADELAQTNPIEHGLRELTEAEPITIPRTRAVSLDGMFDDGGEG